MVMTATAVPMGFFFRMVVAGAVWIMFMAMFMVVRVVVLMVVVTVGFAFVFTFVITFFKIV